MLSSKPTSWIYTCNMQIKFLTLNDVGLIWVLN